VGNFTGSSSLAFHIPATCLWAITCLIFSNAGNDIDPTLTLQGEKVIQTEKFTTYF
jgi:hypothetical protein